MLHHESEKYAYPLLSSADRKIAERVWSELIQVLRTSDFKPSLVHGDLMGGNVLCDPAMHTLTGVLDWSDARVADPAYDFAGVYSISRRLGAAALDSYRHDTTTVTKRAELYLRTMPLRETAWGVKEGFRPAVNIGLNEFRRWTLHE